MRFHPFVDLLLLICFFKTDASGIAVEQDTYPTKPGDHKLSISVGGIERIYLLHLPFSYDHKRQLPLVIVLHGGGGNGENIARMSKMSEKADKDGFITVYPYGSGRFRERLLTWNAGNCCGYALDHKIDDVSFIRVLIEELERNLRIDPKRIYAAGISNGGKMSYVLACKLSDKIAAIAPVAGSMEHPACNPSQPVSVIIFHGTDDEHILYEGGKPKKQADSHERVDSPVSFAVSYWVKNNKCSTRPTRKELGNVLIETHADGDRRTAVVLYTIKGGKHSWPGGTRGWIFGDEPTQEISATDLMWEFFKHHPKQ